MTLIELLSSRNIDQTSITKLKAFQSRDGFVVQSDAEWQKMEKYFRDFPIYNSVTSLMTDGNSNYFCVYLDGPMKGMVWYLDHEEPSMSPRFRNIASLIDAIERNPDAYEESEFGDDQFDFPKLQPTPYDAADREIIKKLHELLDTSDDEDAQVQLSFAIMALTASSDLESIFPFLDHEDMYIQERAIETLGDHKYKPALPKLQELVTSAQHNGQTAAKVAIKKIG